MSFDVAHENWFQAQGISVQRGKKRAEERAKLGRSDEAAVAVEMRAHFDRLAADQAEPAMQHVVTEANTEPDLKFAFFAEARTRRLVHQSHIAREATDKSELSWVQARLKLGPLVLQREEG